MTKPKHCMIQSVVRPSTEAAVKAYAVEMEMSVSAAARTLIEKGLALPKAPPSARLTEAAIGDLNAYVQMRWSLDQDTADEIVNLFRTLNGLPPLARMNGKLVTVMERDPGTGRRERPCVFDLPPNVMADPALLKPILRVQVGPPTDEVIE